jgi:hypothetical protein
MEKIRWKLVGSLVSLEIVNVHGCVLLKYFKLQDKLLLFVIAMENIRWTLVGSLVSLEIVNVHGCVLLKYFKVMQTPSDPRAEVRSQDRSNSP